MSTINTAPTVHGLSRDEFLEKLSRLTIRTTSPDRSVRATLDINGTRVELGSRGSRGHTEQSLAAQVTAALKATQQGYQRAMAMLLEQAVPGTASAAPRRPSAPEQRRVAAVGGISLAATSPRGCVEVRRAGAIEIDVWIRPNTLGGFGFDDAQLVVELNSAIKTAEKEHTRRLAAMRRTFDWRNG